MRQILIVLFLVAFSGACTLFGFGQRRNKTSQDRLAESESAALIDPDQRGGGKDPDEADANTDEEAGVRGINKNLRRFRDALGKRDFDNAGKYLRRASNALRGADDVTKSHPDFEDTERMVRESEERLEKAIEVDRIERRNQAIGELILKGEAAMTRADALRAELGERVPTRADLEQVDALLGEMDALREESSPFLDDNTFAAHVVERDARAKSLRDVRAVCEWQVRASEVVGAAVEDGYRAGVDGHQAEEMDDQIAAFARAGEGFESCVAKVAELERTPPYDASRTIGTRFGALSIDETKRRCVDFAKQARGRVEALTWERGVDGIVESVDNAMAKLRAAATAEEELAQAQLAAGVLSKCGEGLASTHKVPGYDAKAVFTTALGEHGALQLGKTCAGERAKIVKGIPTVEWRITLDGLLRRVREQDDLQKKAEKASDAASAVVAWEQLLGSLGECTAQAKDSSKAKGADKNLPLKTAYGDLTIGALEKACQGKRGDVEKSLAAAIAQREVDAFAASTKGDEKDVVRREGIPARIESFDGGRVFIYEGGGLSGVKNGVKELRRYGFDIRGSRVDYWVEWRNTVVGVVAELTRVLTVLQKAENGTQTLAGIDAARPVLEVCNEILTVSEKSPGYDAKAFFKTPLGDLTAAKLIEACAKEKKRLESTLDGVRWRIRLEELRDRVPVAKENIEKAAASGRLDERIERLGATIGSMQECVERAAVLPKEKGADVRAKVTLGTSTTDLGGVSKTCASVLAEARGAADKALAERTVETFIESHHLFGDEVEVARREGVPARILQLAGGRILVYEEALRGGKKAEKRFAFDDKGKRMDEALLAAQSKGEPKVIDLGGAAKK